MGSNGVKKMLQAGLDEENKNLAKAKNKTQSTKTTANGTNGTDRTDAKKGGRPPLSQKQKRKQYTITLTEEKRNEIMEAAQRDGLSFSRFMEIAANEYMRNKI